MISSIEQHLERETARAIAEEIAANAPHAKLAQTIATFQKWLYLPDPSPLLAVLGTIAANQMHGDPVWTLLIGASGCGKTELLLPVSRLPNVVITNRNGSRASERNAFTRKGQRRQRGPAPEDWRLWSAALQRFHLDPFHES